MSTGAIETILKSIAQVINALTNTYENVEGITNQAAISTSTVVKSTVGRLARVSVTTAGSATGLIYDDVTISSPQRPVYVIPMAVGVTVVNLPMKYGIVVAPGTSQVVTVSYS